MDWLLQRLPGRTTEEDAEDVKLLLAICQQLLGILDGCLDDPYYLEKSTVAKRIIAERKRDVQEIRRGM